MSFFPRSLVAADPSGSFHPLFRLLDDFDQYSKTGNEHPNHASIRTFNPKFDVREIDDVYELHGELPGIDQKDIDLEFTDAQTLTVKGRTERSYTSAAPSTDAIEDSATPAAISDAPENSHQATVEDENKAQPTSETAIARTVNVEAVKPKRPEAKYWVSERSVGEFARSFSFPVRVNQEEVKASIKNGILSVIIPKAKKVESRRIQIV